MAIPEDIQQLMMAAIDDEIDAAGRARLDAYFAEHPDAYAEYVQLTELANQTSALRYVEPPAEAWEAYMADLRPRLERQAGFGLLAIGIAGLALALLVVCIRTPMLPLAVKLFGGAVLAGVGTLCISIWREKRFVARGERYGRVRR